jgi:hypothetical protein
MADDDENKPAEEEEPSPPGGVSPEEVFDEIMQSLLDACVTFDEDDNAVLPELDISYNNVGRGHHEVIGVLLGADAEDAPPEDAPAGEEGGEEGADLPIVDCGSGDPWGAPDTTDDPTQDAADVSGGDPPPADPTPAGDPPAGGS